MSDTINESTIRDSAMSVLYDESDDSDEDVAYGYLDEDNTMTTPNGTKYWIPDVLDGEKPVDTIVFKSFDDAKKMYEDYADKAGFVTRLSTIKRTNGEVTHRYIVCNKFGKPKNDGKRGGTSKRRSSVTVTNCPARVKFKVIPGTSTYKLYELVEPHNHRLERENKDIIRAREQLQYRKQLVSDSKFRRNVNDFIGDRDAQMLVDKLSNRKRYVPNFSFEYECVDSVLVSLFWADEVAKANYDVFGDVLAIGATYGTNKYNMVFVTFMGFDHHKRCVVFGGGLLSSETTESYNWLLQSFLKAHVKQPQLVLTDDGDAVKEAITMALPKSTHRLFMLHIMDKLPLKNTDLRNRLDELVKNTYVSPTVFEESWEKLIAEYKLDDNKWFHDMFKIRERWIPTYFKDIPMCCLTKITSKAEGSNSFFTIQSHPTNTLVQFMICFENDMESLRLNQRELDHVTSTTTPMWMTHLPIERSAAKVYTSTLFTEVQKEIREALYSCYQITVLPEEGCKVHVINDRRANADAEFKVVRNLEDHTMVCSCLNFSQIGYICRHIFYVLRILCVDEISDHYILPRWKRDALPADVFKKQEGYGLLNDDRDALTSEAVTIVEKLASFVEKLKEMENEMVTEIPNEAGNNSKEEIFESLLGVSSPKQVLIKVPQGLQNRGIERSSKVSSI